MNRDPSVFDAAPPFEQSPILGSPQWCFVDCMLRNNEPHEPGLGVARSRDELTKDWADHCSGLCQYYAEDPAVQSGWAGAVGAALTWPTSPALGVALSDPNLNFAPAALGGSSQVWGGRWRGPGAWTAAVRPAATGRRGGGGARR